MTMNYNFFSTLINKTVPFLFKEKLLHLQLFQHTLATAPCGWRVPRWGPVLVYFPYSPRCWVLKYEYICVMPGFPGFDWAQQGVSSRFFPGKCKVIHGEVWVKNSEWSCGVSLKLYCLVAWPLSSVLAPAAFFFCLAYISSNTAFTCMLFLHAHGSKSWDSWSL